MIKGIILINLGLTLAILSMQPGANSEVSKNNGDRLMVAFDKLKDYIGENCEWRRQLNDEQCLGAIKKSTWNREGWSSRLAARIVTHLSSFRDCNEKIIWEMDEVLKAVPRAIPGGSNFRPRLESILMRVLTEAANKCKSHLELMFQERRGQLSNHTRDTLTNLFTPDLVMNNLNELLVKATSKDPELTKKLADMQETEFQQFYRNYASDKVVSPCKDYLKTMSPVLGVAYRFMIVEESQIGAIFDRPSKELKYSMRLFKRCREFTSSGLSLSIRMPKKN